MLVRPRRPDDIDHLVGVARRVHALDGYPPYLPGGDFRAVLFAGDPLGAWVAESDGRIVGHVALHRRTGREAMTLAADAADLPVDRLGVVARLLVGPDHRRRGLARRLLDTAATEAIAQGRCPMLDVVTNLHAAVRLYDACGWVRAGEVTTVLPDGSRFPEFVYLAPPWLRPADVPA